MDLIARAAIGAARTSADSAIGRAAYVDRLTALATTSIDPRVSVVVTGGNQAAGAGSARYVADAAANAALAAAHPRACKADGAGRYFRLLPDEDGQIPAAALRLASDPNDTAAAVAAAKYAYALGLPAIKLAPGVRTLSCSGEFAASTSIFPGAGDWMSFWPGIQCDFTGVTLRAAESLYNGPGSAGAGAYRGIDYHGIYRETITPSYITAPFAAGDNQVTITDASAYAVGDWVLYRCGSIPSDLPETYLHGMAKVTAKSGNTLTLDVTFPRAFTAPEMAAAADENKTVRRITPMIGRSFGDIVFDSDLTGGYTGSEHAVVGKLLTDCSFGSVGGAGLSVGALILQYCYNIHVQKVFNRGARISGTDLGNGSRFAEVRGLRIEEFNMADIDRVSIALEGASVISIGKFTDDNNRVASERKPIVLTGRSHLDIDYGLFTGKGGIVLADCIDNSQLTFRHLHIRMSSQPLYLGGPLRRVVTEKLTLEIAGAPPEVYNMNNGVWLPFRIDLRDSTTLSQEVTPPNCLIGGLMVYKSAGASLLGISFDRPGVSGTGGGDLNGVLTGGSWKTIDIGYGGADTAFNTAGRDKPLRLTIGTGTGNAGKVVEGFVYAIPCASVDGYSGAFPQDEATVGLILDPSAYASEVINAAVPTLAAGEESDWIAIVMTTATITPGKGKAEVWAQGFPFGLAVTVTCVHPIGAALLVKVKNFSSGSIAGATYGFRAEYRR